MTEEPLPLANSNKRYSHNSRNITVTGTEESQCQTTSANLLPMRQINTLNLLKSREDGRQYS